MSKQESQESRISGLGGNGQVGQQSDDAQAYGSQPTALITSTEELEQQVAELTAALQRERADAMNLRSRYEKQLADARAQAKAGVVTALLPVIDSFERAMQHRPQGQGAAKAVGHEGQHWVTGVEKILAQFQKTLEGLGVRRIEAVGQEFDPQYHEAVTMEDGDGDQEIVSEELQPGYMLTDGTVIRHAMVRVKTQQL